MSVKLEVKEVKAKHLLLLLDPIKLHEIPRLESPFVDVQLKDGQIYADGDTDTKDMLARLCCSDMPDEFYNAIHYYKMRAIHEDDLVVRVYIKKDWLEETSSEKWD